MYWLILPLYGKILIIISKFNKVSTEKKDKFVLIFTNRYLIHLIIILITFIVVFSNFLDHKNKDDYGRGALMYQISGISDMEIIQDYAITTDNFKVYNYQDSSLFIEEGFFGSHEEDNNINNNIITQGELALTGSEIINNETINNKGEIKEYVVVEGDTIAKIAKKFGVSVNTILWANGLASTSLVKPGQKLKIPSVSGVIHTVVRGDTLSRIAQKYGVSESVIRNSNVIDGDYLSIGQTLIIPGGRLIETSRPKTSIVKSSSNSKSSEKRDVIVSGTGKMSWPNACYRISQYYKGWIHTGVDIACPYGSSIRAADAGKVVRVQYGNTGYGYNVIIDHGDGISTLYGHLSRIDVEVGQYVAKGEIIGAEGSTGRSTGPHLHFEVRIGGSRVNPLNYIR